MSANDAPTQHLVNLFGELLAKLAMSGVPDHVLVKAVEALDAWSEWKEVSE